MTTFNNCASTVASNLCKAYVVGGTKRAVSMTADIRAAHSPENIMRRVYPMMMSAVETHFVSDQYAASLAAYVLHTSFMSEIPNFFATAHSNDQLAKDLRDTFPSTSNIAELHNKENFSRDIQPLNAMMLDFETKRKALADRLNFRNTAYVVPAVSASSYVSLLHEISKMDVKKLVATVEKLAASINMELRNTTSETQLSEILSSIQKVVSNPETLEGVANTFITYDEHESDKKDRMIGASNGGLTSKPTWFEFLSALEYKIPESRGLSNHLRMAEISSADVSIVDFSLRDFNKEALTLASVKTLAMDTDVDEHISFPEDDRQTYAMILHILNYAGAEFLLTPKGSEVNVAYAPYCLVPVDCHRAGVLIRPFLKYSWLAFLPEFNFTWVKPSLGFATSKKPSVSLKMAKNVLEKAISVDLQTLCELVSETLMNGDVSKVDEAIAKQEKKLISYDEQAVSIYDEEIVATSRTGVNRFVDQAVVIIEVTKPTGILAFPNLSSKGFAECLLVENLHSFGRVVSSALLPDVAKMFNNTTQLHEGIKDLSLKARYDVDSAFETFRRDLSSGLLRRAHAIEPLKASDVVKDLIFTPDVDYYIQSVVKRKKDVLLSGSLGSIEIETSSFGSVHSSFMFGRLKGAESSRTFKRHRVMSEFVAKFFSRFAGAYSLREMEIKEPKDVKVTLEEENLPFVNRLAKLPTKFESYDFDKATVSRIASGLFTPVELKKRLTPALIEELYSRNILIRSDILQLIRNLASGFAVQLSSAYTKDTTRTVSKIFSNALDSSLKSELYDSMFRSNVESMLSEISKICFSGDLSLGLVFFLETISALKITK